jgi:hypothetical protein
MLDMFIKRLTIIQTYIFDKANQTEKLYDEIKHTKYIYFLFYALAYLGKSKSSQINE